MGPNIPGWDNYPLYEELRSVTPRASRYTSTATVPAICMGDVAGAAKRMSQCHIHCRGTGIGAGIIIDRHVLHGPTTLSAPPAGCPATSGRYDACGCFEYYASGNGIGARVRDAVRANKSYKGKLRQKPICRISAYDVFSAL